MQNKNVRIFCNFIQKIYNFHKREKRGRFYKIKNKIKKKQETNTNQTR